MYLQSMFIVTSLDGFVRAGTRKMCNFTSRSVPRPRQSIVKIDAWRLTVGTMCHFTSRSCIRPRQSMGRVARGADKVSFHEAFARPTRPIHGNGCIFDGGVGAGSGFRKNI